MKLNNKGYMLVEIIVAFTITMTMLYFLMNIVIKLKDINEEFYVDAKLENDQLLITKVIMHDINQYGLKEVEEKNNDEIQLTFNNNITKKISYNDKLFKYENISDNNDVYSKKIDERLEIGETSLSIKCFKENNYTTSCTGDEKNKILEIKIPATTSYNDKDYGIYIYVDYNYNDIIIKQSHKYTIKYITIKNNEELEKKETITCNNNCSITLKELESYPGYYVSGWFTDKQFKNKAGKPGKKININSDITYYSRATDNFMYITSNKIAQISSSINWNPEIQGYNYGYIQICDLDGTNCNYLSSNESNDEWFSNIPISSIAVFNNNLYVASNDNGQGRLSNSYGYIQKCNLDGTNCNYIISDNHEGNWFSNNPIASIIISNNNIYIASNKSGQFNINNNCTPTISSIQKCDLNGKNCTYTQNNITNYAISSMTINNNNLYIALNSRGQYGWQSYGYIQKCDLNGDNCYFLTSDGEVKKTPTGNCDDSWYISSYSIASLLIFNKKIFFVSNGSGQTISSTADRVRLSVKELNGTNTSYSFATNSTWRNLNAPASSLTTDDNYLYIAANNLGQFESTGMDNEGERSGYIYRCNYNSKQCDFITNNNLNNPKFSDYPISSLYIYKRN